MSFYNSIVLRSNHHRSTHPFFDFLQSAKIMYKDITFGEIKTNNTFHPVFLKRTSMVDENGKLTMTGIEEYHGDADAKFADFQKWVVLPSTNCGDTKHPTVHDDYFAITNKSSSNSMSSHAPSSIIGATANMKL